VRPSTQHCSQSSENHPVTLPTGGAIPHIFTSTTEERAPHINQLPAGSADPSLQQSNWCICARENVGWTMDVCDATIQTSMAGPGWTRRCSSANSAGDHGVLVTECRRRSRQSSSIVRQNKSRPAFHASYSFVRRRRRRGRIWTADRRLVTPHASWVAPPVYRDTASIVLSPVQSTNDAQPRSVQCNVACNSSRRLRRSDEEFAGGKTPAKVGREPTGVKSWRHALLRSRDCITPLCGMTS